MGKQIWYVHAMEKYLSIKGNELLMHDSTLKTLFYMKEYIHKILHIV